MKETIICWDVDGTIVNPFNIPNFYEKMMLDKDFFKHIPAYKNMLIAFYMYTKKYENDKNIKNKIITSLNNNPYCKPGKQYWITKNIPQNIKFELIFAKEGIPKFKYIDKMGPNVFLIDDYSSNLQDFVKAGGNGIKAINQINGSGNKWKGPKINVFDTPEKIIADIDKIVFE